ncbi:MAG TPA: hypothetical protein PLC74_01590 [Acetobacteraceae bacterium]|nr:hypothetical protein [Acetobacteraceae bacterium]
MYWAISVPSANTTERDFSIPQQTLPYRATAPAEILTRDHATFGKADDTPPLFRAFQSPNISTPLAVSIFLIPPLCANSVESLRLDCREPAVVYIATGNTKIRLSVPIDPEKPDRQNETSNP